MKRFNLKSLSLICGALLASHAFSTVSAQSVKFEIVTNLGTMKGYLYDDMPLTAKTFEKYAAAGDYDGTLFTRVIPGFIIQGGSEDSKNAEPGALIGAGNPAKEIQPESSKNHFYKKGALCAPRPENKNKSDMSQFFIVQGKVTPDEELDKIRKSINIDIHKAARKKFYEPRKAELAKLKTSDKRGYNKILKEIINQLDSAVVNDPKYFKFSDAERKAYTQIGGLPRYAGDYTIYGEITEGLDIIDKVSKASCDKNSRPRKDIKIIKIKIIK